MSEIQFKRVYKGKVTSIRQGHLSPLGHRSYDVYFGQHKAYYNRTAKQQMLIVPGNIIRFTGEWQGNNDYFLITDVLDSYSKEEILLMHHEEDKRRTEGMANFL